jgi:hypothetical protein
MTTIRPATEEDIPRILELYRQLSFKPGDYKTPALEEGKKVFAAAAKVPGYFPARGGGK